MRTPINPQTTLRGPIVLGSMRVNRGVCIGSHFHNNTYMHEQTIVIHQEEVPKLVYSL